MYRILIVDDNEDVLTFLSEVLGDTYSLLLAEHGEMARDMLDTEAVDLVISDIMMPGMDGFTLCQLIKSNMEYCHIPVILLTVKNSYQSHIEGLEVGADLYVQKPFSPLLLQSQIANLLDNRSKIKAHFAQSPFGDVRVVACSKTDEVFLKKLDDFIAQHMTDSNLNIDQLADYMHMSRPTFYRKIKMLSTLSPKELIDLTRLKKSIQLMMENQFTMAEIANMVGFSSQAIFNKNFQRYFKVPPKKYLMSLQKEG